MPSTRRITPATIEGRCAAPGGATPARPIGPPSSLQTRVSSRPHTTREIGPRGGRPESRPRSITMSRPIIVCDRLSKKYNLGAGRGRGSNGRPPSLRESISEGLRAARDAIAGGRGGKPRAKHEFWALKDVSLEVGRGEV